MINKKTLFLILSATVLGLPLMSLAAVVKVPDMIVNIQSAFVAIGSSIVVIGWVVAGILYLTSAGSPEKTGTAKKAMIAAVIGTVLIILAVVAEATIRALLAVGA